jgi:DNA-binding transcriptional MerR regulator
MLEATKTGSLHTTGSTARVWECSESLVRYYVRTGRLVPVATTPNGLKLFALSDVERIRRERQERDG